MSEPNPDYFRPGQVVQDAHTRFAELQKKSDGERGETGRGLDDAPNRAFPEKYVDTLPSLDGENLKVLIEEMVEKNERIARETKSPYHPPLLVDVGYGAGYFLLDAKKRWGNKVKCIGYGPSLDTTLPYFIEGNPPTLDSLIQAGVELIEGNIVDIDKKIKDADIFTASHVVEWTHYPHWELVKKIYRIVAQDGIGLLNECHLNPIGETFDLEKLLNTNGYHFEIGRTGKKGNVAFRKTSPTITLPIIGAPDRNDPTDYSNIRLIK